MNHFEELDKIIYESGKLPEKLSTWIKIQKKIHPNRYEAFDKFLKEHSFKNGLEIGRCSGYSAVAFTTLYPEATLDSIDIIDRPQNIEFFKHMGVNKRINTIVGTSEDIPKGKIYDYVLIDGDHTYEGSKLDWERVQSHIKEGSFVIIDDIDNNYAVPAVKDLWKEISKDNKRAKKIANSLGVIEF